jgi:hypothetical protein
MDLQMASANSSRVMTRSRDDDRSDPPPANWTRDIGYAGYEQVCASVRDFLRAKVNGDNTILQRWQSALIQHGFSVRHEPADHHGDDALLRERDVDPTHRRR